MILTIYLTLLVISLIFVSLGYVAEADLFKFAGYTLLFIISCVGLFSSIEVNNGFTATVAGAVTTVAPVYSTITATSSLFGTTTYKIFAFLQVVASVGGFIFTLGERGREHD